MLHRTETGEANPVFGLDGGFFLFTPPLLAALHDLGVFAALAGLAALALAGQRRDRTTRPTQKGEVACPAF